MEKPFLVLEEFKPKISECNQLTASILQAYGCQKLPVGKLKKSKINVPSWQDKQGKSYHPRITFDQLASSIQEHREFKNALFDMPPIPVKWLDDGVALGGNTANFKMETTTVYGERFPIKPTIASPGAVVGSFQGIIQKNIYELFYKLVRESSNGANLHSPWFNDFRILISECVSIVEITLHQYYYMAKYHGALYGWKFDETEFGGTERRKFEHKLGWIHKGTGIHINAHDLMTDFNELKELRNHLNHFDPPCFAYEVSDLVGWLNKISQVGRLLWKIRQAIDHPINNGIIKIICLPVVKINQELIIKSQEDLSLSGYKSSIWPKLGN